MSLVILISILALGGLLAWFSERVSPDVPRWVALLTVVVALLYLIVIISGLPVERFAIVPDAGDGESWLLYLRQDWIPRFGISLEFGLDGLSLLMLLLTLLLGCCLILRVLLVLSDSLFQVKP